MRTAVKAVFVVCGLLFSCTKDNLVPDLEGSLVGYVYTFDEFAVQLRDRSDVAVTALGLNHYTTCYTDEAGRFEFTDLPTGTYELVIHKPGFGILKQEGIKHLGGMPTTLGLSFSPAKNGEAFFIYQLPKTEIVDLKVENNKFTAKFRFYTPEPETMNLLLYLSAKAGFTAAEAQQTMIIYLRRNQEEFNCSLNFAAFSFKPGEKVYYKACILNRKSGITDFGNMGINGIDSYFDYTTNKTVYPNLGNESGQFSFIMP
jgi:hypothetical protein